MKAMKSMNNRVLGSLKRKPREDEAPLDTSPETQLDTPEENAVRCVRLFCESGGPNGSGEEVLYLPTIVDAAESSPAAARECALAIRKFLSKDSYDKPYIQYNAIMLMRILADNPGMTFTRNIDAKFVQTAKELLRFGRDLSVKQMLMETLSTFQREKEGDEGLRPLNAMWKKEHEKMMKIHGPQSPRAQTGPPQENRSQNYFSRSHSSRRLPNPIELSSRIEEARTSAKLLAQVVQSTPPSELLANELVREFADRCQSASRSIQAYMVAENPAPDNDVMETLIETNEQLGAAINQHQRAVLAARKAGPDGGRVLMPNPEAGPRTASWVETQRPASISPPPGPPPNLNKPIPRKPTKAPQIPPPGDFAPAFSDDEDERDPFADPNKDTQHGTAKKRISGQSYTEDRPSTERLGIEPYHPGFHNTPSYVNRQDSSLGKVTMHAAAPDDDTIVSPESANTAEGYGVQTTNRTPVYRY